MISLGVYFNLAVGTTMAGHINIPTAMSIPSFDCGCALGMRSNFADVMISYIEGKTNFCSYLSYLHRKYEYPNSFQNIFTLRGFVNQRQCLNETFCNFLSITITKNWFSTVSYLNYRITCRRLLRKSRDIILKTLGRTQYLSLCC